MRSERLHTYDFDMKMCTSVCSQQLEPASRISFGKNNKRGIWCENQKWKLIRKCLSDGRVAAFIHLAEAFIQSDL